MKQWTKGDWFLFALSLGLTVYSLWAIYSTLHHKESDKARAWYRVYRGCQSVAERVGRWGIAAENRYHAVNEAERMN